MEENAKVCLRFEQYFFLYNIYLVIHFTTHSLFQKLLMFLKIFLLYNCKTLKKQHLKKLYFYYFLSLFILFNALKHRFSIYYSKG